jgi:hypothetical protein
VVTAIGSEHDDRIKAIMAEANKKTRRKKAPSPATATAENVLNYLADSPDIPPAASELSAAFISEAKDNLRTNKHTSCLNSAEMLFEQLSQNPTDSSASSNMDALIAAINGIPPDGKKSIHIKINGMTHGFVVILDGDQAKILQSFASGDNQRS